VLAAHDRGFDPRDLAAAGLRPVAGAAELAAGRAAAQAVQVAPEVLAYVVDLCRATRTSPSLSLGVSPRGATACCRRPRPGRGCPVATTSRPTTSRRWPVPTLRHRVAVRPEAELEGVTGEGVLDGVLASVPVPR
jgi:MoxR-like ATPase